MSIRQLGERVTDGLSLLLPGGKRGTFHPGPVSDETFKRWATGAPAILVTVLGSEGIETKANEEMEVPVRFAAFIVTRSTKEDPAHCSNLDLVQSVLQAISREMWDEDFQVGFPRDIRFENLFRGNFSDASLALFGVSWTQAIRIGTDVFAEQAGPEPTDLLWSSQDEPFETFGPEE